MQNTLSLQFPSQKKKENLNFIHSVKHILSLFWCLLNIFLINTGNSHISSFHPPNYTNHLVFFIIIILITTHNHNLTHFSLSEMPRIQSFVFTGYLPLFLLLILSPSCGGSNGDGALQQQLWCVAKNNAEDAALQTALDWACGAGGANCGPIQNGGPCYDVNSVQNTASYAFNDYFLKHGLTDDSCNFNNNAAVTSLNPSNSISLSPSMWFSFQFVFFWIWNPCNAFVVDE